MAGLITAILPREDKFFDMFARQAGLMVEAADALVELLQGGDTQASSARIRELETAADDVTREVLRAVRRSFITPFDRSAITSLISKMDDAVDEIWHTAKTVGIYRATRFEPQMRQSAELAAKAARLVGEAMPLMRNTGRNGARLHEITEAIVHLEAQADALHDAGLSALFEAHGAHEPTAFFVGREIYRYVERVLDRMQDVADEIQGIVIDHA
jgi:predicted phosphate transport protein (TIGR00153 family)